MKDYIDVKFNDLSESLNLKLQEAGSSLREENSALEKKTDDLQQTIKVLASKVTAMSQEITQLQRQGMKNNLIIDGIPEEKDETAQSLKMKVTELLENDLDLDEPEITLTSWHRLSKPAGSNRPRAVLIRVLIDNDRERILRASSKLKGKKPPVFINPQLPRELEYSRRMMRRVAARAKVLGHKVSYRDDKILIDGKVYDLDNVQEAPLNTAGICTDTLDTHVCFYGALSPFSNFHQANFMYDDIMYTCSEQLIQREKAQFFGKEDIVIQIMTESNPLKIKSIGDSLTCNQKNWEAFAADRVYPGLKEKFLQNPKLLGHLQATEERRLVECNPSDKFWSCGISMRQFDDKKTTWPGKNVLGELLTRIRDELKRPT